MYAFNEAVREQGWTVGTATDFAQAAVHLHAKLPDERVPVQNCRSFNCGTRLRQAETLKNGELEKLTWRKRRLLCHWLQTGQLSQVTLLRETRWRVLTAAKKEGGS